MVNRRAFVVVFVEKVGGAGQERSKSARYFGVVFVRGGLTLMSDVCYSDTVLGSG